MNNLVLDRIQRQRENNFQPTKVEEVVNVIFNNQNQIPLLPSELQITLENLFAEKEPIVIIPQQTDLSFPDLFHFCEWYLNNKQGFSERQQKALNTLVEGRDLINVGCACK